MLPPTSVRRYELDLEEDWRDVEPPEHHINVCEFAHASTSVVNADKDGSDTSLSSHVEMPVLDIPLNDVFDNEQTIEAQGLPLTVCETRIQSYVSYGTDLRKDRIWLCLLSSAEAKAINIEPGSLDPKSFLNPKSVPSHITVSGCGPQMVHVNMERQSISSRRMKAFHAPQSCSYVMVGAMPMYRFVRIIERCRAANGHLPSHIVASCCMSMPW